MSNGQKKARDLGPGLRDAFSIGRKGLSPEIVDLLRRLDERERQIQAEIAAVRLARKSKR
jgi:hypothetical protein